MWNGISSILAAMILFVLGGMTAHAQAVQVETEPPEGFLLSFDGRFKTKGGGERGPGGRVRGRNRLPLAFTARGMFGGPRAFITLDNVRPVKAGAIRLSGSTELSVGVRGWAELQYRTRFTTADPGTLTLTQPYEAIVAITADQAAAIGPWEISNMTAALMYHVRMSMGGQRDITGDGMTWFFEQETPISLPTEDAALTAFLPEFRNGGTVLVVPADESIANQTAAQIKFDRKITRKVSLPAGTSVGLIRQQIGGMVRMSTSKRANLFSSPPGATPLTFFRASFGDQADSVSDGTVIIRIESEPFSFTFIRARTIVK